MTRVEMHHDKDVALFVSDKGAAMPVGLNEGKVIVTASMENGRIACELAYNRCHDARAVNSVTLRISYDGHTYSHGKVCYTTLDGKVIPFAITTLHVTPRSDGQLLPDVTCKAWTAGHEYLSGQEKKSVEVFCELTDRVAAFLRYLED